MSKKFKKAAIFYNENKKEAVAVLKSLNKFLKSQKIETFSVPCYKQKRWINDVDIVITLGGDGTVLHAARVLDGRKIPLLGVNLGSLGFLSSVEAKDLKNQINDVLKGKFKPQRKYLIEVKIIRGSNVIGPHIAFNDCVFRTVEPRIMKLRAKIDNKFLIDYLSDGLIVSTPAGSTAYALASGGPIVFPGLDAFILAPICPHTLTHRPIVVSAKKTITVKPILKGESRLHMPVMSIDGQTNFELTADDEIVIKRSKKFVTMLIPPDYDYFKVLNRKLKWGER